MSSITSIGTCRSDRRLVNCTAEKTRVCGLPANFNKFQNDTKSVEYVALVTWGHGKFGAERRATLWAALETHLSVNTVPHDCANDGSDV